MKNLLKFLLCILIVSCGNDNAKLAELEKKVDQQSQELAKQKEEDLKREIEEKDKKIKELETKEEKKVSSSKPESNYFARGEGEYPYTSERYLNYSDLSNMSKRELKIMRNEIFARHGYIFKTNDMINYFSQQYWYKPLYENVDGKLSKIEKENISFIKRFE